MENDPLLGRFVSSVLWIALPSIFLLTSLVLRFTILPGLWYFLGNVTISATTLLYVLTYYLQRRPRSRLLLASLLFQFPITFFSAIEVLDDPGWNVWWAILVHKALSIDRGYLGVLGILHGAVGVYVYILGSKLPIVFDDPAQESDFLQDLISRQLHRLLHVHSGSWNSVSAGTLSCWLDHQVSATSIRFHSRHIRSVFGIYLRKKMQCLVDIPWKHCGFCAELHTRNCDGSFYGERGDCVHISSCVLLE